MKTLAIRLDDGLHAQLIVLAQLRESTITEEIRLALESHLEGCRDNPELTGRAQAVLDEIERDSQSRQAAIGALFGTTGQLSGGAGIGSDVEVGRPTGPATQTAKPPTTAKSGSGKAVAP